ncbi:MAG: chloride channel protein [bacterium]|nr:chloride channel protein [bacterium]MDD6027186.1 chloride channel protein [bacterium]
MTQQSSEKKKEESIMMRLLRWREEHVSETQCVIILALLTGIISGLAAVLLKRLIETISEMITSQLSISEGNYLYLITPVIGILIVGIYVRYVVKDNISHGVTQVLYAISQKKSRLKIHNMYTSVVASSITIGFGGSVGAEGPIVYTGAAIGSNLGSMLRLSPRTLMVLVGCGAAAGIAGIFKAPIAGVLFTVEVLMLDLTAASVMPLMVAAVAGATVSYVYTGYNLEFFFSQSEPFYASGIPYVIMLGLFCGFVSLYFTGAMGLMEKMFGKLKNPWVKFAIGSVILSTLIYLLPPLYGEGYGPINMLLNGNVSDIFDNSAFYNHRNDVVYICVFIGMIIIAKVFATSATNGGGGVGGTFAPSLYVGCMAGFFFAYTMNALGIIDIPLSTKNFALAGMAGVMSGVMHAPLMAIFLTAEMTGGYELFLPLLIVSAISYGTVRVFSRYSIYTKRLAIRGELLTHEKDKTVLTLLKIDNVIETDFLEVHPDMNLKEMVQVIAQSHRNLFPVTDSAGNLMGIVLLDDIRNIMFRPDLYRKMYVSKFMSVPPAKIELGMPMEQVMKIFDNTNAWNLPVVENGKYIGFVSKSKIFNSYRSVLKHYTED